MTAVVNASGSLARSQGTTSAGRVGAGQYEVIFNQDVTNCTYGATIGSATAELPDSGEILVARRTGNVNGVSVGTRDSSGVASDRPFHLVVVC